MQPASEEEILASVERIRQFQIEQEADYSDYVYKTLRRAAKFNQKALSNEQMAAIFDELAAEWKFKQD